MRDLLSRTGVSRTMVFRVAGAVTTLAVISLIAVSAPSWAGRRWLPVEHRELILGIPMEGELRAVNSDLIGPPQLRRIWNFQIAMIGPEGEEVVAGQPVLGFDTTELRQRLRESTAEADSAEKGLEKAETDLGIERRQLELRLEEAEARLRQTSLKASGSAEVTAARELQKARIDRGLAEREIASLRASIEQHAIRRRMELATLRSKLEFARTKVEDQKSAIQQMTVKAPRDGTLIMRSDWRGEKKQVGDRVWRAETVVEIPDLSVMEAAAEVGEQEAGRLVEGQRVSFRLDAYPDREYSGTVALIRRTVQSKSFQNPSKVVKLTIELDETDTERMRPGMRFVGTIEADVLQDVLSVPVRCVGSDEEGAFVEVRGLLSSRKIYPELGRRNDDYVEVVAGLRPGDLVRRPESGETRE